MIVPISALSIVAYLIFLWRSRNNVVQQQILCLAVFLVGTAIIGELDVLLPLYFVFSFFPFLPKLRKMSRFTAGFSLYCIVYLLVGLLFQNPTASLVTFIAKMWQFLVVFILLDEKIEVKDFDYKKVIWVAIVLETALGVYLFFTSTMQDEISGFVRLVSNSQPITGNLATCTLPVTAYYYQKTRGDKRSANFVLKANIYLLIWIVLSGTRGYILEYVAVMFLIFYDYFMNRKMGRTTRRNRLTVVLGLLIIGVVMVAIIPDLLEKASSILRVNQSVGVRTYENATVLDYLKNAPLHEVLFGIGIGGKPTSHPAFQTALNKQVSMGMWHQQKYQNGVGAIFHSLYSNAAICIGVVGVLFLVAVFMKLWKKVNRVCEGKVFYRRLLHCFLISFFVMNYYRWSADCGIAEMILFALMLKLPQLAESNYPKDNNTEMEVCSTNDQSSSP